MDFFVRNAVRLAIISLICALISSIVGYMFSKELSNNACDANSKIEQNVWDTIHNRIEWLQYMLLASMSILTLCVLIVSISIMFQRGGKKKIIDRYQSNDVKISYWKRLFLGLTIICALYGSITSVCIALFVPFKFLISLLLSCPLTAKINSTNDDVIICTLVSIGFILVSISSGYHWSLSNTTINYSASKISS